MAKLQNGQTCATGTCPQSNSNQSNSNQRVSSTQSLSLPNRPTNIPPAPRDNSSRFVTSQASSARFNKAYSSHHEIYASKGMVQQSMPVQNSYSSQPIQNGVIHNSAPIQNYNQGFTQQGVTQQGLRQQGLIHQGAISQGAIHSPPIQSAPQSHIIHSAPIMRSPLSSKPVIQNSTAIQERSLNLSEIKSSNNLSSQNFIQNIEKLGMKSSNGFQELKNDFAGTSYNKNTQTITIRTTTDKVNQIRLGLSESNPAGYGHNFSNIAIVKDAYSRDTGARGKGYDVKLNYGKDSLTGRDTGEVEITIKLTSDLYKARINLGTSNGEKSYLVDPRNMTSSSIPTQKPIRQNTPIPSVEPSFQPTSPTTEPPAQAKRTPDNAQSKPVIQTSPTTEPPIQAKVKPRQNQITPIVKTSPTTEPPVKATITPDKKAKIPIIKTSPTTEPPIQAEKTPDKAQNKAIIKTSPTTEPPISSTVISGKKEDTSITQTSPTTEPPVQAKVPPITKTSPSTEPPIQTETTTETKLEATKPVEKKSSPIVKAKPKLTTLEVKPEATQKITPKVDKDPTLLQEHDFTVSHSDKIDAQLGTDENIATKKYLEKLLKQVKEQKVSGGYDTFKKAHEKNNKLGQTLEDAVYSDARKTLQMPEARLALTENKNIANAYNEARKAILDGSFVEKYNDNIVPEIVKGAIVDSFFDINNKGQYTPVFETNIDYSSIIEDLKKQE